LATHVLWEHEIVGSSPTTPTINPPLFRGDRVARETLYFADPFEAPEWRRDLVELRSRS
jgi:hypothetical protein